MLNFFDFLLIIITLGILGYGTWRRVRLWRLGKPLDRRDNPKKRWLSLIRFGIAQANILKESYPGFMHLLIFWGFLWPFLVAFLVALRAYAIPTEGPGTYSFFSPRSLRSGCHCRDNACPLPALCPEARQTGQPPSGRHRPGPDFGDPLFWIFCGGPSNRDNQCFLDGGLSGRFILGRSFFHKQRWSQHHPV